MDGKVKSLKNEGYREKKYEERERVECERETDIEKERAKIRGKIRGSCIELILLFQYNCELWLLKSSANILKFIIQKHLCKNFNLFCF